LGFDHTVSTDKMASIFSEVFERVGNTLPKPPFASLMRSDPLGRVYTVYLYVEHPEDVFTLRPQISEEVFKRWDMERKEAAESAVSVQEQAKMPQERMTLKEEKDEKQRKTRSQNN
jgi:hypothetical protein